MAGETTGREWARDGLGGAVAFVVFAGLYLLFAGELSADELIAGIPAALAVTCFAVALRRTADRHVRLRAPWPRLVARSLAALPVDACRVGRVLVGAVIRRPDGPVGATARQPFREGLDDPADAGRRGLVTLAASLPPNAYVLAITPGELILHRLTQTAPDPAREWPL